jgi:serine protease Do
MRNIRFRRHEGRLALLAICLAAAAMGVTAPLLRASSERSIDAAEEQAFRRAALSVGKSVVRIQTVGGADRVGGMLTGTAATTGVVVSEDGYIVSSAFNFISKPSTILIHIEGAHPYTARLVATDHLRMLTLLKIDATGLTPLRVAHGKKVEVGQWAISVGRTYDSPEPSISVGIVSAVNRVWGKAIQTDAKVSPVNYGGPLIDVAGDALGVVVPLSPTAKEETAGVEWYDSGIGFAIPIDDVLASAARLKKGKDLFPGLLGVNMKEASIDERPTIDHVRYDSPAEHAGIKAGDILTELDGHAIGRHDEIKQILGRKYGGDKVAVVAKRGDSSIHAEVTLTDVLNPYEPALLGILPARVASGGKHGVVVRYVFPNTAAATAGIAVGDRIEKWNGKDVTGADQLSSAVRLVRPGTAATAVIVHDGARRTLDVKLTADIETIPRDLPAFRAPAKVSAKEKTPKPAAEKTAGAEKKADTDKKTDAEKKPKTGLFRDSLPGDSAPNYWAYVPESYSPDDAWGLVVWIAPARDGMEATILARWQSLCEERRLILVAPLPSEAAGFNPNDLVGGRQVVEHFFQAYRIDRNRVIVHSFAMGGRFAAALAFENREQFRGLALASSLLASPPPETHPNFPFRFFVSFPDVGAARDRFRGISKLLRDMKYAVTLQTTTATGRTLTYPDAAATAELARWVDSLDRI